MAKETWVWATLSFGVGLILAPSSMAQSPGGAAPTPPSTSQPAPAPSVPLVIPPLKRQADQPTYSVGRPEGSSGIYLPAAVLGYTRSVAGCVVAGCADGPEVHVSSEPPAKPDDQPADSKSSAPR